MIEEASIDIDGGYGDDGTQVKAFLQLHGDFVIECERYLADDDNLILSIEISRDVAEELYAELAKVL